MKNFIQRCLAAFACIALMASAAHAQNFPRGEDVVQVPAKGEGLYCHNLFQSNMVLQRDKPIAIWGWAAAGETVTVSFADKQASSEVGDDGKWTVTLPAMPANSKPQQMTVKGKDKTITFENILLGDVWVLGGQSNMEHPISRVENGDLEIASANFPNIRILTVPAAASPELIDNFPRLAEWSGWFSTHYRKGHWDVCNPQNVRELSAIGYVFARRLHMATQVPIGVIDASRGGTTVETWTPIARLRKMEDEPVKELLATFDAQVEAFDPKKDLEDRIARYNARTRMLKNRGDDVSQRTPPTDVRKAPNYTNHNFPGNCYAGMIHPLRGLAVKGAIFHQGYNNCFDGTPGAVMYRHVFPEMITAWREAFGNPNMAFGILSLCTQGKKQEHHDFTSHMADVGPFIREAQYQTFLQFLNAGDKNVGFTSTYDLSRRWYHPQLKVPAGERIARWALATQYGMRFNWMPPILKETKIEKGRIVLKFQGALGKVDNGLPLQGFAIAGEDRKFHPAETEYLVTGKDDRGRPRLDRTTVVLKSMMVPEPVAFRYAWARMPMGNALGATDVPMGTMRSDNWPMEATPNIFEEETTGKLDRRQMNQLRKALRKIDEERQIAEAKAVLKKFGPQEGKEE